MTLEQRTDTIAEMERYLSDLKKITPQKFAILFLSVLLILVLVCIFLVSAYKDDIIHFESPFTVNIDRVKMSGSLKNETSLPIQTPYNFTLPTSNESIIHSENIHDSIEQVELPGFTRIPPLPELGQEFFEGSGRINGTT